MNNNNLIYKNYRIEAGLNVAREIAQSYKTMQENGRVYQQDAVIPLAEKISILSKGINGFSEMTGEEKLKINIEHQMQNLETFNTAVIALKKLLPNDNNIAIMESQLKDLQKQFQNPLLAQVSKDKDKVITKSDETILAKKKQLKNYINLWPACKHLIPGLCKDIDLNEKDENGETPLHWAARKGERDLLKMLLTHGKEVNPKEKNDQGETPLIIAAKNSNIQQSMNCISLLLSLDTDDILMKSVSLMTSPDREILLKRILELNPQNPQEKNLLDIFEKTGINLLFNQLLLAKEKGDFELLGNAINILRIAPELRTKKDQDVLSFIEKGNFVLALDRITSSNSNFWKMVETNDIKSITLIQKLRDLDRTAQMVIKDQETQYEILSRVIGCLHQGREEAFVNIIGYIQFLLPYYNEKIQFLLEKVPHLIEEIQLETRKILEQTLSPLQHTNPSSLFAELSVVLAQNLITAAGNVNSEIIDDFIDILRKNFSLKPDEIYKIEITIGVLKMLKNQEFNERLSKIKTLPGDSRRADLVNKILHLKQGSNVSSRDAQVAVVSALLWPLRQGQVGSCFVTSIAIQLASHEGGVKQLLEDYISLINNGCLTRKIKDSHKGTIDYPLVLNKEHFFNNHIDDNLLTRAFEYTLANTMMSSETASGLRGPVSMIIDNEPLFKKLFELEDHLAHKMAIEYKTTCSCIYSPEKDSWVLVNVNNGKPFVDMTDEEVSEFFIQLSDNVSRNLKKEDTEGLQTMENCKRIIKSNKFFSYWNSIRDDLIESGGGDIEPILENYHTTIVTNDYINELDENCFRELFEWVKGWSQQEKDYVKQNQGFVKTAYFPSLHAMNLRAHAILKMSEDAQSDEKIIIENMQQKAETLLKIPITSQILEDFFQKYSKLYEDEFFANKLIKQLMNSNNQTIQSLYELLLKEDFPKRSHLETKEEWTKRIEQVLRSNPALSSIFPEIHYVIDTNWDHLPCRGYSWSPFENKMIPFFIKNDPLNTYKWSLPNSDWKIPRFLDTTRYPLLRNYYQVKE